MFSWFKKKKLQTTQTAQPQQNNFDDEIAKEILYDIKNEFGLEYSKQEYLTIRKIERFAIKNDIHNFKELQFLLKNKKQLKESLINMLTVGETYFYREFGHFEILKTLMEHKNISRILCAPSSSGEEVYSVILYLKEQLCSLNISVTGIDINTDSLNVAKKGCFSKRSISYLPPHILQKYFYEKNQKFCILDEIKQYSNFKKKNIFSENLKEELGRFEVIFCRNMLIYFDENEKKRAIENLRELLCEGGVLFLGHADISFVPKGFAKTVCKEGSYLQKESF